VLGASALVARDGVVVSEAASSFDIPVAIAVAFACLPVFARGFVIRRWEGALFLAYYVAYVVYLYLDNTGHAAAPVYNWVMLSFVIPLTAITVATLVGRDLLRRRAAAG